MSFYFPSFILAAFCGIVPAMAQIPLGEAALQEGVTELTQTPPLDGYTRARDLLGAPCLGYVPDQQPLMITDIAPSGTPFAITSQIPVPHLIYAKAPNGDWLCGAAKIEGIAQAGQYTLYLGSFGKGAHLPEGQLDLRLGQAAKIPVELPGLQAQEQYLFAPEEETERATRLEDYQRGPRFVR